MKYFAPMGNKMVKRETNVNIIKNYSAASYGVSKALIRNEPFAASCGELSGSD